MAQGNLRERFLSSLPQNELVAKVWGGTTWEESVEAPGPVGCSTGPGTRERSKPAPQIPSSCSLWGFPGTEAQHGKGHD